MRDPTTQTTLHTYGWTAARQDQMEDFTDLGLIAARVVVQQRSRWHVVAEGFDGPATMAGRFAHEAGPGGHPVAGDWVAIDIEGEAARIHGVLPRHGALARKAAGTGHGTQIVAANVDLALLVMALNGDFNPRRLERYLALAASGGVRPVIVLTKTDLVGDAGAKVDALLDTVGDVVVLTVSSLSGQGLDVLQRSLKPGQTSVLLGSSGAGKSTLVNALAGRDLMATGAIRESDGRGMHTTSHRELLLLPNGALILDTPGMREIGLADGTDGVRDSFSDLEDLALHCQFTDCTHTREPKCALRAAIHDGELDPDRLAAWQKLRGEAGFEARKTDPAAKSAHKKRSVAVQKAFRAGQRDRRGDGE
jgi:ribosome biogenesis GTPase / thiamine phosphate phosphatase